MNKVVFVKNTKTAQNIAFLPYLKSVNHVDHEYAKIAKFRAVFTKIHCTQWIFATIK